MESIGGLQDPSY